MTRYSQLVHAIKLVKPKSIVEIGTWCGNSAINMINTASKFRKNIQYVGYDLFETATEQTDNEELNLKAHHSIESVEAHIKAHCPSVELNLIKGNTRETLNYISADFCFIDGGHSLETIANDYEKCKYSAVIILDDYYTPDNDGACPDKSLYGCNRLVDTLPNAVLLPIRDEVKTGGMTQMVMVLGERA